MAPAGAPMWKNSASGARYANVGMICMTSSTGVIARRTRAESPAQTPIGTPIASDSSTATATRASASTLDSHSPSTPNALTPATATSAIRQPPASHASAPMTPVMPGQPRAYRVVWNTP